MSKFQLVLGWAAVVGSTIATLLAVLVIAIGNESLVLMIKLIWMPFVFLWGLRQIRTYNYDKRLNDEHDK